MDNLSTYKQVAFQKKIDAKVHLRFIPPFSPHLYSVAKALFGPHARLRAAGEQLFEANST